MEKDEGNAMMEALDATNKLNLVEVNEPVQSKTVAREQEEIINENSTAVEKDLVEGEQEVVINENVSSHFTTDNGLNSLGTSIEENSFIQEKLTEDTGKFVKCIYFMLACIVQYLGTLTIQASNQATINECSSDF